MKRCKEEERGEENVRGVKKKKKLIFALFFFKLKLITNLIVGDSCITTFASLVIQAIFICLLQFVRADLVRVRLYFEI
jgi:hypothetical protein